MATGDWKATRVQTQRQPMIFPWVTATQLPRDGRTWHGLAGRSLPMVWLSFPCALKCGKPGSFTLKQAAALSPR